MKDYPATHRFFTSLCFLAFFILALQTQSFASGDLDATFTAGVTTFGSSANVVVVQTDGRVLVGGQFVVVNGRSSPGLVRLNADGTIDQSFNIGSGINPGGSVNAIAIQTDGKILVGGAFIGFNGAAVNYLARLNSDGSLDTTFNMGGAGLTAFDVKAISLQTNGQILVGGFFNEYNGVTISHFARLNANGSLDTTFATNLGTGFDQTVNTIAVETDGQIVVGGIFSNVNGTAAKLIARLNSSGTVDTAFTTNGGTGFPAFNVNKVLLQANGQILVGGRFFEFNGTPRADLLRLNADGSLDMNFDPVAGGSVLDLLIQANGQIIAAGNTFFGAMQERTFIARLNQADGSLDLTFDAGTTFFNTNGAISSIAFQLDGSIFAAGNFPTFSGVVRSALANLNGANGSLNAAFTTVIGLPGQVNDLLVLPDNKILIAGLFSGVNESFRESVARLNADGSTDTTFNAGLGGVSGGVSTLAVQPSDGKIIVGGSFQMFGGENRSGIVRLNTDGSIDATFNASVGIPGEAIAIQPDGKILIGGNFSIARLNTDGTTDVTFNSGTGFDGNVEAVILQANGQILVGGGFATYNGTAGVNDLARLNSNGTLDAAFSTNIGTGSADGQIYTLALQTDGKIVAAGFFSNFNGTSSGSIARLNTNGTLDGSYNVGTGFGGNVNDLALQPDGRILAVGGFGDYNGTARSQLARLNTDGSLDTSFTSGVPPNSGMLAVGVQCDGRILIGGFLESYGGVPRFGVARLTAGDTITWTGAADLNWNNSANWSTGFAPTSTDNAIIPNNFTVNLSGGNFSATTLTVGASATLTIAAGSSLTAEGVTNDGTISGAGTLNFIGTALTNDGTISAAIVNANLNMNCAGFNPLQTRVLIGGGSFVGNTLTIASGVTLSLQDDHQFNTIVIQGTLDATSRVVSLRGANPLQGSGSIILTFGTIIYDGAAAQTIAALTYNNLTLNNSAGASLGGNVTVGGALTLQAGTLNVGANTLTLNSTVSLSGGSFTSAANGTVNYNQGSNGQAVLSANYGNLTFSNFNKILPAATIGIAGTFTPGNATGHTITGSTFDFNGTGAQTVPAFNYNNLTVSSARGGANVIFSGTIGIAGVFNPSATAVNYVTTGSTFLFNGAGAQTIPVFSYNNLTLNNAGGASLGGSVTVGGALTLTTGILAIGTNTLTLNGAATATSGSFSSAATGTINYNQGSNGQGVLSGNYGNLTFSNFTKNLTNAVIGIAGVFTPGSASHTITGSTFVYNGTTAQVLPSSFTTYNNLTLNNAAGVTGFAGLIVQSLLRVQQGTFVSSSDYNNVQIDGGATLAGTNATTINVSGNWTNDGTFTANGNTVNFNGAAAQTIGGSATTTFNNLIINNSAGVSLNTSATVNGALTLTAGTLAIGSNTLTLNGAATATGGSFSSNAGGTVNYNQASNGQAVLAGNYGNLTFSNFNKTLPAATVGVAGTFTPGSGTATTTGSTFVFNGAGAQTIPVFSYNNLTLNNAAGASLGGSVTVGGALTLTTGTLAIGTITLTLNGAVTATSGSFSSAATGTVNYNQGSNGQAVLSGNYGNLAFSNFNKDLTNSTIGIAGTFTPGSGTATTTGSTFVFNGAGAQTIPVFSYNNLTLNNAAGASLGGSVTVGGALTLTTGTLAIGTNTLALNGAATATSGSFSSAATGTINYNQGSNGQGVLSGNYGNLTFSNFTKNLTNAVIGIAGVFTPGSASHTITGSTFVYNGTTAQVLPSSFTTYNNLTLNNAAGVTVGGSANVSGLLTLTSGNTSVGGTLSVGGTGSITRTAGHIIGNLRKTFSGPGSFTYHVGTTNGYSPLATTVTAGSGDLTVMANQGTVPPLNAATTLQRYWTMTEVGSITADLTFNYLDPTDIMGNEANYRIIRVEGGTPVSIPNNCPTGPCVNPATNTAIINGVANFSEWTLGESFAPTAITADLSGRVSYNNLKSIRGVTVSLLNANTSEVIVTKTNAKGHYKFSDIVTGAVYIVTPSREGYEFNPQNRVINHTGPREDLDFEMTLPFKLVPNEDDLIRQGDVKQDSNLVPAGFVRPAVR